MCYDYINSVIYSSSVPFKLFPDIRYPAKITAVHKRLKRELYNMNEAYDLLINEDMRVSFMTAVYDVFFTEEEKATLGSIDDMIKKSSVFRQKSLRRNLFSVLTVKTSLIFTVR